MIIGTLELILAIVLLAFLPGLGKTMEASTSIKDKVEVLEISSSGLTERSSTVHPLEYTEEDVYYLTQALYFEDAMGKSECQLMIAHVIQNRKYTYGYPNTVRGVVWQDKQFSFTHDGKPEEMKDRRTYKALEALAKEVLGGYSMDNTGGALHYYNPDLANPNWKHAFDVHTKCGGHIFLVEKDSRIWS